MSPVVQIGLDIAKRWFQVHAVDEADREIQARAPARQGSSWLASAVQRRARILLVSAPIGDERSSDWAIEFG